MRKQNNPKRRSGRPKDSERKHILSTRERILKVAVELFGLHGVKGTTTRMISEKVGIRQPSLFNHFKKKSDILEALVEEAASDFFEYSNSIDLENEDCRTLLYQLAHFDVKFLLQEPYGIQQIISLPEVKNGILQNKVAQKYGEILGLYRRILSKGIDKQQFSVEDSEIAAHMIVGMVESAWQWRNSESELETGYIADVIARMVVKSVSE